MSFTSVTRPVSQFAPGTLRVYGTETHRIVFALILGIVPEHSRSQVVEACKRIGVTVSFDRAKTALKSVKGIARQIMNSLEACCTAGTYHVVIVH